MITAAKEMQGNKNNTLLLFVSPQEKGICREKTFDFLNSVAFPLLILLFDCFASDFIGICFVVAVLFCCGFVGLLFLNSYGVFDHVRHLIPSFH